MSAERTLHSEPCPYCAGKGGRYRNVYSRFLGTTAQVHQGPWETCWKCNGSGVVDEKHTSGEASRG